MAPFFTVIIPTFNRYDLACRAIRSVLSQTLHDFELIVVDDHSENYPLDAFLQFSDPRLSFVKNQFSKGACGARNTGILLAKGEWVSFLDDDDEWLPEKLAQEKALIASPDFGEGVVMVYSGVIAVDGIQMQARIKQPIHRFPDTKRNLLYRNYVGGMSSVTVRLRDIKAISGFDEHLPSIQDLDLFIRLSEQGVFKALSLALTLNHKGHNGRITMNPEKKSFATAYLREKYRGEINSSVLLRFVFGSRNYRYAIMGGQWRRAIRSAPWVLAGLVLDPGQFRKCVSVSIQSLSGANRIGH